LRENSWLIGVAIIDGATLVMDATFW